MATAISANKAELLAIANSVASEKMIDKGIVIEAIEEAIQRAARARYGAENDIRAKLDAQTGDLRLWRVVEVVETVEDYFKQVDLAAGQKLQKDAKIRRVVMCSGKVYYDLLEEREKRGIDDVYLLRLEQLYPFPAKALINELSRFRNAEMVWCQEEPKNMGAWAFIDPYLEWVLAHIDAKYQRVRYTGRPAAASPATGLMSKHLAQLAAFLEDALGG